MAWHSAALTMVEAVFPKIYFSRADSYRRDIRIFARTPRKAGIDEDASESTRVHCPLGQMMRDKNQNSQ